MTFEIGDFAIGFHPVSGPFMGPVTSLAGGFVHIGEHGGAALPRHLCRQLATRQEALELGMMADRFHCHGSFRWWVWDRHRAPEFWRPVETLRSTTCCSSSRVGWAPLWMGWPRVGDRR